MWHDSFISVTWLIHMCDMTHSYVCHDSFICVTWLIHIYVWHDSIICVTWLIHMSDMTHSYVWHDSFICVTWLNHMRDMTRSWDDSLLGASLPSQYGWSNYRSFWRNIASFIGLFCKRDLWFMRHIYRSWHIQGTLSYCLFYRALLQKRPMIYASHL